MRTTIAYLGCIQYLSKLHTFGVKGAVEADEAGKASFTMYSAIEFGIGVHIHDLFKEVDALLQQVEGISHVASNCDVLYGICELG